MVTHNEIRLSVRTKDYAALRAMHGRATAEGIEGCDTPEKLTTVNLCVLEVSMFKGTSPGHERQLEAMLQAIERGRHPYDDAEANAVFEADGAIAAAQLKAMVGR